MNGKFRHVAYLGLVLAVCVGCGGDESENESTLQTLNQVKGGAITFSGKELPTGAILTLHPKDGAAPDVVVSGEYGGETSQWAMMTKQGSEMSIGAKEGTYTMTVQPPKPAKGRPAAPWTVPAKYGAPATSDVTVEVKEGTNVVPPIDLKP